MKGGIFVKYRIDFASGGCDFVRSRQELVEKLGRMGPGMIADIRRLYKSGVTDSVKEKYLRFAGGVS